MQQPDAWGERGRVERLTDRQTERERDRQRERQRETERDRETEEREKEGESEWVGDGGGYYLGVVQLPWLENHEVGHDKHHEVPNLWLSIVQTHIHTRE